MVSTSRYFCQNCRKEVTKDNRVVIRMEDPNTQYGTKTLKRIQLCKKCVKKIDNYMERIGGRLAWTNRNVIMRDEYDSKRN